MAITRIFASIIPAQGVNHTVDQRWNIFGIFSKIIINGDQWELPNGLEAYLRFVVEGSGRLDGMVRFRSYDDDTPINETPFVIDSPPGTRGNTVTCYDLTLKLPIQKLYPKIAASSVGSDIETVFIIEILVPRSLVDPSYHEEDPEKVQAAVLAASPIFLVCRCNPAKTETKQ